MDVLTPLLPAALFSDQRLFSLVVARMANLSLEHGHTDGSCLAYVWLGLLLGPSFNNYPAAFAFGQLGLNLLEKRGLNRFRARVLLDFSHVVNPWMQHARIGPGLVRRAFDAACEVGDLTFAGYSCWNLVSALMATGAPLSEVQREAEKQLAFVLKLRFGLIIEVITGQLRLILAMRGLTPSFSSFDGPDFDEPRFERRLDDDPAMAPAIGWYGVRKLQGRFFAGDYRGALAAADKVEPVLWTMPSHLEVAEYHLYAALAKAACYTTAPSHDQPRLLRAISAHYKQIDTWAEHCPENFENRAALVGAEIARIEGRELDAQGLYEQAIRSARANGFVHNEALAYELAAYFYLARGFEDFARVYLHKARHGYLRWGAEGKVRQIDEMYPHLRTQEPPPHQTGTIEAAVEQLDVATVIKASQAVSSEIMLDKLLDTLMRAALEHAGAGRGLMILLRGDERRIAAEAITRGDTVTVQLRDETATATGLPESVLHYVLRTQEIVILDDVATENPFSADTYLREKQPRSILCLPLINQAKLIGILYLENELASHAFAPARVVALKLLASQAAISLENSRLYRDLQEREAKIRRLVDANVVGVFIWDFDGRILEANDAFLRIVGYDREDLAAGRISWTALTPMDWRERDAQWIEEQKRIGLRPPIEKEYFRKDGRRVPILLGAASFGESESQGVAFVLDLTQRKAAEEALRQSEERFRTLVQFSFEVYWETDAQHRFVRQEFSDRLSDAPPADSELGKTRWEVPYLEPDEDAWQRHRETLDAHLPFRDFELVRLTPKRGKRYLSVSGLPMFEKAGRFIGYRGVARDITERKRASEALREARVHLAHANRVATMGQLTASIAHEVNQPITATILNAETGLRWLGAEPPDLDEARQAFGDIMRDGNRAGAVLGRIRALIKGAPRRNERVEINAAIREVVELTRGEATKNRVVVQTDLGDDLPLVPGDRVELQQVILNLILNAIEAMNATSEGSRELLITKGTTESDDVLVAVRDSGPGLAPATLEHLFKAFHTTKPNGLGLGLSICRSIIEGHGGRLWASANSPRGAVFQFTLPVNQDVAARR
jgi:PAS domain S-box-containing protein